MPNNCPQLHQQFRELIDLKEKFDSLFASGDLNKAYELKKQLRIKLKEIEPLLHTSIELARSILDTLEDREKGITNVFGPAEVKKAFDIELKPEEIPPIPFSQKRLARAKELGQFLVLRVDKAPDGSPLTMQKMNELLQPKLDQQNKKKILCNSRDEDESFYAEDVSQLSWALVSKEIIPGSIKKDYLRQTQIIVDYIQNEVFNDQPLPPEYQSAINEFDQLKDQIETIISSGWQKAEEDWKKAAELLSNLKITQLTRQSTVEAYYDILIYFQNNRQRLLESHYTWTKCRGSNGRIVMAGRLAVGYTHIRIDVPDYSSSSLGVSFSCRS